MFDAVPPPDQVFIDDLIISESSAIVWLDARASLGLSYAPLSEQGSVAQFLVETTVKYGRNSKKMAQLRGVFQKYAAQDDLVVSLLMEKLGQIHVLHTEMKAQLELIDGLIVAYKNS